MTLVGYRSYAIDVAQGAGAIDLNQMDICYAGNSRPGAGLTNGFAVGIFATSGGNRIRSSNLHNTAAEAIHVSATDAGQDTIEDNDIHDSGGAEWKSDSHNGAALIGMRMIVRGNHLAIHNNRIFHNGYHGIGR